MTAGELALFRALIRAIADMRDATKRAEVARALEQGDVQGALDAIRWDVGEASLAASAGPILRTALEQGAGDAQAALAGALDVPAVTVRFNIVNPGAVDYVRDHGASMIQEFGDSSMDAIRDLIERTMSATERLPSGALAASPQRLARQIIDSGLGLREAQLETLERYRAGAEAEGMSQAMIDARMEALAARMLKQRAELIARTEIINASREGNQELWRQAMEQGLIGPEALQQWNANADACPECEELDGETAALGEAFPGGSYGPTLHPACRCSLTLLPFGRDDQ